MIYFRGLQYIAAGKFRSLRFESKGVLYTAPILFLIFFGLPGNNVSAAPVDQNDAYKITRSWLSKDAYVLGRRLGDQPEYIKTFTDDQQHPVYHIVYLYPSGYLIVSAEEPPARRTSMTRRISATAPWSARTCRSELKP